MSSFAHAPHRGATDTWLTPPAVVAAVGPFDLDPCAAPAPRPWPTARTHYDLTAGQDGKQLPWHGMVWVNPPYGPEAGSWMALLATHGTGVGLLLARTETDWFFKTVWARAAGLLFLRGRLHFHDAAGRRAQANCGAPPVLVGYGDEALRRLARAPLDGHLVVQAAAVLLNPDGARVGTWQEAIEVAAMGRTLRLRDLYAAAEGTAKVREAKAAGHNWRAQLRRALQRHFQPHGDAVWGPA